MEAPNPRVQFRLLFRDFLSRIIDLDAIAPGGDLSKLLGQFTALLAAFSFTYMVFRIPGYFRSPFPPARLQVAAWYDEEFLIALTMVIVGMFAILAWNSVLPDRRDCLILTLLPIRLRTIFAAKVGAIAAALVAVILALNLFIGLTLPPYLKHPNLLRALAAYWITVTFAGLFIYTSLLALQGVAMHLLPYRLFLKVSSFLQLLTFFVLLGAFFLRPPLANPHALTAPQNQLLIECLPSVWFLGLFQQLNGPNHPVFAWLAQRALIGLAISFSVAALTFGLAWRRNLRRIVEQPDIPPADRTRASGRVLVCLTQRLFHRPLDRAIVLFTGRTIARSRQHRLLIAAYCGIGFAIALSYARELLYGPEAFERQFWIAPWNQPNRAFLTGSLILLFFAAVGARAVFSLPYALNANWIFRVTAVNAAGDYFRAVKRALAFLTATPVWLASAVLFFAIWPAIPAAQHLLLMALAAAILISQSLYQFRKIPFACSYLPGKANLQVRLGAMGIGFLFFAGVFIRLEYYGLHFPRTYFFLLVVAIIVAIWTYRSSAEFDALPTNLIQFEETPVQDIHSLDLSSDGSSPLSTLPPLPTLPAPPRPSFGALFSQAAGDLRHSLRLFSHSPGFALSAIVLIALGIGSNAAIFSILHAVLDCPAAGVHASNLVRFGALINGRPAEGGPEHSYIDFRAYADQSHAIRSLIGSAFAFMNVDAPAGATLLRGQLVTQDYFPTLGVHFARGRSFTRDEEYGATGLTAVLAYHVWQNQYQSDPNIIGRTIVINGSPTRVIGVTEQGFGGTMFVPQLEAAIPLIAWARQQPNDVVARTAPLRNMEVLGQLAPGVSLDRAQAEFRGISKRLQQQYPDYYKGRETYLVRYTQSALSVWASRMAGLVQAMLNAVGLITLLIVCANVANLMLGRAVARQREIAVRRSLGASRGQILRMLVAEGFILSLAASVAAWFFASWTAHAIVKFAPPLASGARFQPDLSPDWRTAVYALALAAASAFLFAAAPAFRIWSQDLLPWLKAGEQGVVQGRSRLSRILVVVQIALCVTLLTGAGLATRSLAALNQTDLHFEKDRLLLARVNTQGAAQSHDQNAALLERLRLRLAALPGVTSASYATATLGTGFGGWTSQAQASLSSATVEVQSLNAGPGYLSTAGVHIAAGRDFVLSDLGAPRAAINRDLADALWPGQNALGRTFLTRGQPITVTAVVANGAYATLRPGAHVNFIFLAEPSFVGPGNRTLYLRLAAAPDAAIAQAVRTAVRETDNRISLSDVRPMQAELDSFNQPYLMMAQILGIFSAGSLFIAAIGLYAVSAFQAARRTRDFGIRMALGASSNQVLGSVLREGLVVTAIGLIAGLALSAFTGRALASILIGVTPADPATYAGVTALLAAVSLAACLIPARRASRIDPMRALREE